MILSSFQVSISSLSALNPSTLNPKLGFRVQGPSPAGSLQPQLEGGLRFGSMGFWVQGLWVVLGGSWDLVSKVISTLCGVVIKSNYSDLIYKPSY